MTPPFRLYKKPGHLPALETVEALPPPEVAARTCTHATDAANIRYYPVGGEWRALEGETSTAFQPRPATMPLLARHASIEGHRDRFGPGSALPVPGVPADLLAAAAAAVKKDRASLNFDDALDAEAELDTVCLKVLYRHAETLLPSGSESCYFSARVAYSGLEKQFYLLWRPVKNP